MVKNKRFGKDNGISKDSVLNDSMLDVDIQSDAVEVINSHVDIANKTVSSAAVIKNTEAKDKNTTEQSDEPLKTKIHTEAINKALEDKGFEDQKSDNKDSLLDDKIQSLAKQKDDIKGDLLDKKEQLTDTLDTLKDDLKDKVDDVKDDLLDKKDETLAFANDIIQKAASKADEVLGDKVLGDLDGDNTQDNTQSDDKQKAEGIFGAIQAKLSSAKERLLGGDEADDKDLGDQADDIKQKLTDLKDDVADNIKDKADELKEQADDLAQQGKETAQSVREKISDKKADLEDKVQDVKEELLAKKDDLTAKTQAIKDAWIHKADTLKENWVAKKDEILDTKDELVAKKDELLDNINQTAKQAAKETADYQKNHDVQGLSGKLAVLGAYLGSIYNNKDNKDSYQKADLSQETFEADIFHKQGSKIAEQLFGTKAMGATELAKKVLPEDKFVGISEFVYTKIANWANAWANKELQNDSRFANIHTLSDSEREAFADDIANQNRALATLGGVTGFFGLKGVVLDTAWLLLISLKSVYELAIIYNKPLTGQDGIKLAYGILSACDLDKAQEKQVVMTALALGNTVLVNAQSTSISDELKKIGTKYQNRSYAKGFDEISKLVNLDRFNPTWLHWLLPVTSTAVATHYNNELIGEVLGVARATFTQSKITALIEDKTQESNILAQNA